MKQTMLLKLASTEEQHQALLETMHNLIKGQADLLYRNGTFSLAVTLDVPVPDLTSQKVVYSELIRA